MSIRPCPRARHDAESRGRGGSRTSADFYPFDMGFLGRVATRIIKQVKGGNRVVYAVNSKPPGTIAW